MESGVSSHQLRHLYRHLEQAPAGEPIIRRVTEGANLTYSLLECSHCGGWANHSVVIPET